MCKDYVLHISKVSVDNDKSYLNAIDEWESNWIPMHENQHELRHSTKLTRNLEEFQDRIDTLRGHIMELEATPGQPTFAAVAAASGDKPLTRRDTPAPPAPTSTSKKLMPVKPQAAPTMAPAATPPATQVARPPDARATSKDKGKGHALPGPYIDEVPAGIPSFKEDHYGYNLAFDDNKFDDEYAANYTATSTSNMAARVSVILTWTTPAGNSATSSTMGGELAVLHLENLAEFRLAMDAMEAAHCEGNDQKMDLLASICKVVLSAHKLGGNQSLLEKSITHMWWVPDWLPTTRYDQVEGKHVPLNFTVGQQHEYHEWRDHHNQQQLIRRGAPKPLA